MVIGNGCWHGDINPGRHEFAIWDAAQEPSHRHRHCIWMQLYFYGYCSCCIDKTLSADRYPEQNSCSLVVQRWSRECFCRSHVLLPDTQNGGRFDDVLCINRANYCSDDSQPLWLV